MPHLDQNTIIIALAVVSTIFLLLIGRRGGVDPKQVDSLISSGLLYKQQNDYIQSQMYLERALNLIDSSRETDNSKLSSCLIHLAESYDRQNKYKEARESRARLLNVWKGILNSSSVEALIDIDYFASNCNFGPGAVDVCQFYQQVVDMKRNRLGENHSDVADSLQIHARLLRQIGEKEQAQESEDRADEIRKMKRG